MDDVNQYPFPFDHRFCWNSVRLLRGHKVFTDMMSKWLGDMTLKYMNFLEMPEFGIETKFKLTPRNQREPAQGEDVIIEELISPDVPDADDEPNQHANEAEHLINVPAVLPINNEEFAQPSQAANRTEHQVIISNAAMGTGSINPAEPNDIEIEVNIEPVNSRSVQPNATNAAEGAQVPAVEQMEIDIDIDDNIDANQPNPDQNQGNENVAGAQANVPNYNNAADFQAAFIDPNAAPPIRRPFLPRPRRNLPQQDNGNDSFQVNPPEIRNRRRNRRNQNARPVCIQIY